MWYAVRGCTVHRLSAWYYTNELIKTAPTPYRLTVQYAPTGHNAYTVNSLRNDHVRSYLLTKLINRR